MFSLLFHLPVKVCLTVSFVQDAEKFKDALITSFFLADTELFCFVKMALKKIKCLKVLETQMSHMTHLLIKSLSDLLSALPLLSSSR